MHLLKKIMKDKLIKNICQVFGIKRGLLFSKSRKSEIVRARQIIMYLLRFHTNLSASVIGLIFDKNHATVLYSEIIIKNILELNHEKELIRQIKEIEYKTFYENVDVGSIFRTSMTYADFTQNLECKGYKIVKI